MERPTRGQRLMVSREGESTKRWQRAWCVPGPIRRLRAVSGHGCSSASVTRWFERRRQSLAERHRRCSSVARRWRSAGGRTPSRSASRSNRRHSPSRARAAMASGPCRATVASPPALPLSRASELVTNRRLFRVILADNSKEPGERVRRLDLVLPCDHAPKCDAGVWKYESPRKLGPL